MTAEPVSFRDFAVLLAMAVLGVVKLAATLAVRFLNERPRAGLPADVRGVESNTTSQENVS